MISLHRRFAIVLLMALILPAAGMAQAQQAQEKVLKKQTIKKVAKSIEKLAEKGFVPMDAIVDCNGRRAMFSVRMVKPEQPFRWFAKFGLSDSEFESAFEQNKEKKLRVIWHEEYQIKEEVFHAAIWHFDSSFAPLTKEESKAGSKQPQPKPMGRVWEPNSRIPTTAVGLPAFAELERKSLDFIRGNQMPALSVAVSLKGKMLYQGAYGYSDLSRKKKVTPEQPFRCGGIARILTVVAALQLVDQGKLKLDQPVYPMLNVTPWKPSSVDVRSADVTVLHLLQETAGHDQLQSINPGQKPRFLETTMKTGKLVTPQQMMEYMISQPLSYTPGSETKDSAYSFFLLGRVIEKAAKQPYEEYVLENIAKPLGMTSLRMSRTDPDKRTRDEVVHIQRDGHFYSKLDGTDAGGWVRANEGAIHYGLLDASHGWMASPGDLIRLMTAIQASPSPILSDASKVLMTSKPGHADAEAAAWKGCVLYCRKSQGGITLWRHTQDLYCSVGLVCFSSNGLSYCYMFNTHKTVAGEDPRRGFDGIVNKEANKVWRLLEKR